ncbi:G-type lectin S-receptor-like serine/threonine-protein kinase SD2-5 [Thalictrum thalictroides]|uniref:G-type lectin S-receptor-like serine/threonine-protein kinase SD2-5 n=1 Tax=Thalictrum thalictroides TaxID=46969 RepID=A0A7J6V8M5_THATH|nr:G-type lectin S-receptor-like serine/threonine-protein kinase SD2-5 [Thalictrum thalictroides]
MGITVSELVAINLFLLSSFTFSVYSIQDDFPTANLSTLWTNNDSALKYKYFSDGSLLRYVLLNMSSSSLGIHGMGCGFYQNGVRNEFYFVVFVIQLITAEITIEGRPPRVLWTANRNRPVDNYATLEFTSMGDLVLKDGDDKLVWSTNTSDQSVVGIRVDGTGNLILHSANSSTIWQSFDHPTDIWLPGQKFTIEQRLVTGAVNLYRSPDYFYMELRSDGFHAYIVSNSTQLEQSQVLTAMRGTRGYLAPEWFLNRRISEKVDVYSFGIVVLEIMCGRKNLDYSQPEENECLLHLVKKKVEQDQLVDIVDKRNEDMLVHTEDAVEMIRTAIWCLQGDAAKRPSMSMVVKVLEGVMVMDNISDYSFLTLIAIEIPRDTIESSSVPPLASILSGAR